MPTYTFLCRDCGHKTEKFLPITTGKHVTKCAWCGGKAKRIIEAGAGVIFRGSGFYVNDYKKGGKK